MNRDRFCALWQRNEISDASYAQEIYRQISRCYGELTRFYHNTSHILQCLEQLDLAAEVLGKNDAVELAIWFHDVVYTPGDKNNEQLSADWFHKQASGRLSADLVDQVVRLILCTQHGAPPSLQDEQYIADIDLSGFGMSAEKFHSDGLNIRREMSHVDDQAYIESARRFMQNLLNRGRIFSTGFFHDQFEETAIANINQQLARFDRGEI